MVQAEGLAAGPGGKLGMLGEMKEAGVAGQREEKSGG